MKKIITQTDKIAAYLRTYGSITPLEALDRFGCMRLGARISELRQGGMIIRTEIVSGKSRTGRKTHYARYIL